MRKIIYVSQWVDVHDGYGERRDAMDQRWVEWLWQAGFLAVPVPNHCKSVEALITQRLPGGILLTGGNNPKGYGGDAPERDSTDYVLIDCAVRHKIPLVGVCRGMQSIVLYFGGTLREVSGHTATRHAVNEKIGRVVNSFHSLAVDRLPDVLSAVRGVDDGVIEFVTHNTLFIIGIMWHPEREKNFNTDDIELIRGIFA